MDDINRGERREFPRYPFTSPVTFQIVSPVSGEGPWARGITENVTAKGICLVTEETLEASQVLKVRLPLPDTSVTVPTLTEVRWAKRASAKEPCKAGLLFLL